MRPQSIDWRYDGSSQCPPGSCAREGSRDPRRVQPKSVPAGDRHSLCPDRTLPRRWAEDSSPQPLTYTISHMNCKSRSRPRPPPSRLAPAAALASGAVPLRVARYPCEGRGTPPSGAVALRVARYIAPLALISRHSRIGPERSEDLGRGRLRGRDGPGSGVEGVRRSGGSGPARKDGWATVVSGAVSAVCASCQRTPASSTVYPRKEIRDDHFIRTCAVGRGPDQALR
jgi:hypothetical protein